LPEAAGVPQQNLWNVRYDVAGELDSFFGGTKGQQLRRVADRLTEVELGMLEVQPPRLYLRTASPRSAPPAASSPTPI